MRAVWTGWIVFVLLASSLLFIPPHVKATITGDSPPPVGDWNVYNDTVVENETIILNGNLTVYAGATLTFRNVTLKINSTSSQYYAIEVLDGATFRIFDLDNDNTTTADASVIERNNLSNPYFFRAYDGSVFEMRNSELHGCGDATTVVKYAGLYIETDNATIDHSLISYNYDGIVLYGSDATVSNNTITWNDDTGIYAGYWSNGTIENNWITWSNTYAIWADGGGNTNPKPSNITVIGNVITDTGRGTPSGDGISITYCSYVVIKNTVILRSSEDGIGIDETDLVVLDNITIDGANFGVVTSSGPGDVHIYNSTIKNISNDYFVLSDANYVLTNVSFVDRIYFLGVSTFLVRWYLHVYVEDSEGTPIPTAEVRIKDNQNGTYDRNFSTDLDGYVKWIVLSEYWQKNSTAKVYYTPYNITVNYTGLTFLNNPRDADINVSKTEIFTATTPVPEFDSIIFPVIFVIVVGILFLKRRKNRGERSSS